MASLEVGDVADQLAEWKQDSPSTIAGKISGARNRACSSATASPFRRAADSDAMVPRIVAAAADTTAIWMLRRKAVRMLSVAKNVTNQRNERPCGGKAKNSEAENAVISTIRIGPKTNRYVRPASSRRTARMASAFPLHALRAQNRQDQAAGSEGQPQKYERESGGERPAEGSDLVDFSERYPERSGHVTWMNGRTGLARSDCAASLYCASMAVRVFVTEITM